MTHFPEAAEQARIAEAPGAVPPTGGVPPEDAHDTAHSPPLTRVLTDDLVDGLDLLLRATRSTLGAADVDLEQAAQRAIVKLQQLGEHASGDPQAVLTSAEEEQALATIAHAFGREIDELARRLARRIEEL
jgi:hypothetical protein